MEDKVQKYADLAFTKEKFLSGVRVFSEGMVQSLPAEVQEELFEEVGNRVPELMDKIMVIYDEEYPAYRETFLSSVREHYTEDQLDILIDIHVQHPWMFGKYEACLKSSFEDNQENGKRVGQRIVSMINSFIEEIEGQKADEHPGV